MAHRNLLRFSEIQITQQLRNAFNGYALIRFSVAKFSLKYNKMLGDERRTVVGGGGHVWNIQGVPGGMCQTSGECSLC